MCDCVSKVNEQLVERNTVLSESVVVSRSPPGSRMSLLIKTEKLDSNQKRTKPLSVVPSFCPFCGEKLNRELKVDAI